MQVRQEVTDWSKADYRVPQHIYITSGSMLVGYVPEGTTEAIIFSNPKKQWSPLSPKVPKSHQSRD